MLHDHMVVSVVSDDPFAIDVAHYFGQEKEIADLIALKMFANSEYCPRFISDDGSPDQVGNGLTGQTVVIVSTCCGNHTRNALAMKTCLVARAAKDNGAKRVILVEPDLFYSAQDRGPRQHHGEISFERQPSDYKKFNGQPWTSFLYAQLLHTSGIDDVVTVHNHSISVQRLFAQQFKQAFHNLSPADLYAHFLMVHGAARPDVKSPEFIICAPDQGAQPFVREVCDALGRASARMLLKPKPQMLTMTKVRSGERQVSLEAAPDSPTQLDQVAGKDVVVFDDMVRTGSTIVGCCRLLKEAGAKRVTFMVTHFYSSPEVKENLNDNAIDEIVTTNTLPTVLNRDMQGRLRRKMLVLKIEKWIAGFLRREICDLGGAIPHPRYDMDLSSKNPRWRSVRSAHH